MIFSKLLQKNPHMIIFTSRNTTKRKASLEPSTSEKSEKLEKSDSPASSCVSLKPMDPLANFNEESGLNLRVKQERSESPAPSCVSVRSKDLPMNFKEEFTPDSKVKQERSESPAPSCVSVRSKDLPMNFKAEFTPDSRVKQERSESTAPSCVSLRSMDLPVNFKEEFTPDSSEFITSLLTEDHFRCTVCTDVLKDPVSIPCGHSYCKQCITSYWAQPNHAGHYACPQCSQSYSSHPALCTNSALADVVQKLQQFSPVLPTLCYAGPGDVACDFCTGRELRAVKSCLTCTASYCESHVRQHYTVPALQKHTLVEPTHIGGHRDKTDQWDIKTEDLQEEFCNDQNQKEMLEKQDRGVHGISQDAATVQNSFKTLSVQRYMQALCHACECRNANCMLPSCQKMKRVVQHTKGCERKTNGGCPICKWLVTLLRSHAKHFKENECHEPYLNNKQKLRLQQLLVDQYR